jgi:plasmid replication initiation protein
MSQLNSPDVGFSVPDSSLKERYVNMDNVLVRAAQSLSLAEKRIVSCCIAKFDSKRLPDTSKPVVARISAMEFAETFGLDRNTAYEELKAAEISLSERWIRYEKQGAGRKGRNPGKMRWVGRVDYAKGEGWLEIAFWPEILPYLFLLRERFTSYKLSQAAALRSIFSWRLLELFSQFRSTGLLRIDIEEFAHVMDASESCRKNFKDMRRRIIEPAVNELTEKDGYQIEWDAQKAGRKVVALEFRFTLNPQTTLF